MSNCYTNSCFAFTVTPAEGQTTAGYALRAVAIS